MLFRFPIPLLIDAVFTFYKHRAQLTGVTFWNLSDQSSRLDRFPVAGRNDYPLLFDQHY